MKTYRLLLIGLIFCTGCTTFKAAKTFIENNNRAIQFGVSEARKMILAKFVKNPDTKAKINLQLEVVSQNLYLLAARADWSPEAVTEALKVEEPYADEILRGVGILINVTIDKFAGEDAEQFAVVVLKTAADALSPVYPQARVFPPDIRSQDALGVPVSLYQPKVGQIIFYGHLMDDPTWGS